MFGVKKKHDCEALAVVVSPKPPEHVAIVADITGKEHRISHVASSATYRSGELFLSDADGLCVARFWRFRYLIAASIRDEQNEELKLAANVSGSGPDQN